MRKCSPEMFTKALVCPTIKGKIESCFSFNFKSTVEQVNEASNLFEDIIISTAQLCLRRNRSSNKNKE